MPGFKQRLLHPVAPGTAQLLREKWAELPPTLQNERQIYGRNEEGCGATVGVMPRCNFACTGCYLGTEANRTPPLPLEEVYAQLRTLRTYLGPWGNLQLTDGEVTLRPTNELIAILRYARSCELIPMLMTHGDTFRRQPDLLERLMREGGLDEMNLHIDSTQRGRRDYRHARNETELMPLREEYAASIRAIRRRTKRPLRVAATITVTRDNLDAVPMLIRWHLANADAFRLVAFLPAAQVGRTRNDLGGGVTQEQIWQRIEQALNCRLVDHHWWFGHPDCSRWTIGAVARGRYHPASIVGNPRDATFLQRFFDRFAGITFRADTRLQATARVLGMIRRHPAFMLLELPAFAARWVWRTRSLTARRLTIATHQFMSREQVLSPAGQERIDACVFKVPVDGRMVSMCTFNTLGGRDALYAHLQQPPPQQHPPTTAPHHEPSLP